MFRIQQLTAIVTFVVCSVTSNAQTDYTSLMVNPSFEQGTDGWEITGMNAQTNSIFSIKDGNTYMERWTGRGGSVGSAKLSQTLRNLPPGNYELSVGAQNIQEDTPNQEQTGAWVFAETPQLSILDSQLKKTDITVCNTYTVNFNVITGNVTIGFEAQDATGNYLCIDNFRLSLIGTDLSADLLEAVKNAEATYGNATGKEVQQLQEALAAAKHLADQSQSQPTAEEEAAAIIALDEAIGKYLRANATAENPLDMTSSILNTISAAVKHICDDRQPSAIFNDGGWGSDVHLADNTYIPNCMVGAEKYFAKGLYDSGVTATFDSKVSSLKVGIKCTSAPSYYWMMFDHFRLYFFGVAIVTDGIRQIGSLDQDKASDAIFDFSGRRVMGQPAPGIYIVNGKKILINRK